MFGVWFVFELHVVYWVLRISGCGVSLRNTQVHIR